MPENIVSSFRSNTTIAHDGLKKQQCMIIDVNWLRLPYELWLTVLVDYGVCAADLVCLEYSAKWFSNGWGGGSVTEEAARLIIKRYKRKFFGDLVNRIGGASWKEKLYSLEKIASRLPTTATGSYQNITLLQGRLLTWGAGRFGQLGNNCRDDSLMLQDITGSVPQEAGNIIQVSAGCGHSGFVTENGHAFTFGDDRYNQLGHHDFNGQTCAVPTRIVRQLSSQRCLQIACGSCHTLFLTDMGQVYSAGLGDSGQLGLGPGVQYSIDPVLIPLPYEQVSIGFVTAGIAHNILVSNCGKAYTFGLASVGQLGHGGTKKLYNPTQVSVLRERRIVYAAASVSHSIFLDSSGAAFTCGKGRGLLGHGDSKIKTVPTRVQSLEDIKIVRAAAGVSKSIFISSEGFGYWCGEGMGHMKNHIATLPTVMRLPEPLHSASIGNSHTVLVMRSGCMMSVGNNGRHQTGVPTQNQEPVNTYTYMETPS